MAAVAAATKVARTLAKGTARASSSPMPTMSKATTSSAATPPAARISAAPRRLRPAVGHARPAGSASPPRIVEPGRQRSSIPPGWYQPSVSCASTRGSDGPRARPSGGRQRVALESDEARLRRQGHAEPRMHSVADLADERQHFGRAGAAAIHDRQRVLVRQAGAAALVTLVKPRALDEPPGRELERVAGREARRVLRPQTEPADAREEARQLVDGDHRIDEERAVAARVGVGGGENHPLATPQREHRLAHARQ